MHQSLLALVAPLSVARPGQFAAPALPRRVWGSNRQAMRRQAAEGVRPEAKLERGLSQEGAGPSSGAAPAGDDDGVDRWAAAGVPRPPLHAPFWNANMPQELSSSLNNVRPTGAGGRINQHLLQL